MASVNKVILIGHLGADPEVRSFQNGGRVANFRIATSESWKDKNTGERKERTEWHSIVVTSDGLCGVVKSFLKKGSKIYVEGQLRTRKWQDQSGNDRYSTEVVVSGFGGGITMLDRAGGGNDGRYDQYQDDRGSSGGSGGSGRSDGGSRGGGDWGSGGGGSSGGSDWGGGGGGGYADDLDDDIPF